MNEVALHRDDAGHEYSSRGCPKLYLLFSVVQSAGDMINGDFVGGNVLEVADVEAEPVFDAAVHARIISERIISERLPAEGAVCGVV